MVPLATYKYPDGNKGPFGTSGTEMVAGKLSSTVAGTVNCPSETGALQVK
jgi:hypothetical protein